MSILSVNNPIDSFRESSKELKKTRTLVIAAMLVALNVAMSAMGLKINITEQIRISPGFITAALNGMLFGPVVAMIAGACTDILGFAVSSTGAYFPGFTLSAMIGGILYGLILYKRQITVLRALVAKFSVSLIVNVFLNTFWMTMVYGKNFVIWFPARVVKNVIMLPIEVIVLYLVVKLVAKIEKNTSCSM